MCVASMAKPCLLIIRRVSLSLMAQGNSGWPCYQRQAMQVSELGFCSYIEANKSGLNWGHSKVWPNSDIIQSVRCKQHCRNLHKLYSMNFEELCVYWKLDVWIHSKMRPIFYKSGRTVDAVWHTKMHKRVEVVDDHPGFIWSKRNRWKHT